MEGGEGATPARPALKWRHWMQKAIGELTQATKRAKVSRASRPRDFTRSFFFSQFSFASRTTAYCFWLHFYIILPTFWWLRFKWPTKMREPREVELSNAILGSGSWHLRLLQFLLQLFKSCFKHETKALSRENQTAIISVTCKINKLSFGYGGTEN